MLKLKDIAHNVTKITRKQSDLWLLPEQLVALEVEVENFRQAPRQKDIRDSLRDFWTVEDDGSLRNNGAELVSGPQYGRDLLAALSVLEQALPQNVVWSLRTSVHVHLDVREWTTDQLLSMIYMYIVLEYVLFEFSPHRRNNQYCVPWFCSGANDIAGVLHILRQRQSAVALKEALSALYRYSALNLKAVHKFATVEFRHMHGTNNAMELVSWINILMGLIKAGDNPSQFILAQLKTQESAIVLLRYIYGPYYKLLEETEDYSYNINQGLKSLQNILFMLEEHYEKQETNAPVQVNKESSYALFRKKKIVQQKDELEEEELPEAPRVWFDEQEEEDNDGGDNRDEDEAIREEEDRDNDGDDNDEGNGD